MSLNLTESNRKSNYYLSEIERLSSKVADKVNFFNETNNVKYYGAVGDGVVDDTVAIQECINANDEIIYFPEGTYRITDELDFVDLENFTISSNSAVIFQDHVNPSLHCFFFDNCKGLRINGHIELKGSLDPSIVRESAPTDLGCGIYMRLCQNSILDNIKITGPFLDGIYLDTQNEQIGDMLEHQTVSLCNLVVKNCVNGINMSGEYYNIYHSNITLCRNGVYMTGGNNTVSTSMLTANRIGIYVLGGGANSDHGKIIGCTLNHNIVCGILLTNIVYSFAVSGCQIWANQGDIRNLGFLPVTFTDEVTSTTGKTTQFGVYLEDVENINLTGCTIAHNRVNTAVDGMVTSTIAVNSFRTGAVTTSHIIEYGGSNSTYNRNSHNTICSNTFVGNFADIPTNGTKKIKFFNNPGITLNDNSTYFCRNNTSTTERYYLNLADASVSTDEVIFDPSYEYMILNVTNDAAVKMHSALGGAPFSIYIIGITASQTKAVQLLSASTYNGTDNIAIIGTGVEYNNTTKTYTFSKNGHYSFVPTGPFTNQWTIICNTV